MALTKVNTGGLALDAVDNTILKLDDDYALTGTVSGTGAFQKVSSSSTTQTGLSSLLIALPTTTDFTSLKLILIGLKAQSAATQFWGVRFSSSSSVVTSTSYNYMLTKNYSNDSAGGITYDNDLNANEIRCGSGHCGDGSDDSEMTSLEIDIHHSATNGRYTRGFLNRSLEKRHNDTYHYGNDGSFYLASGNVIDGIQIRLTTGNVFTTYGYSLYKTLF
tara:strand:+ start:256 stop:912 length:657 start_codon:yes stop_codon:yes gene_type:complete